MIRQQFAERTRTEAIAFEQALAQNAEEPGDAVGESLKRMVHRWVGSLSLFGFDELGAEALTFGELLQTCNDPKAVLERGMALAVALRSI